MTRKADERRKGTSLFKDTYACVPGAWSNRPALKLGASLPFGTFHTAATVHLPELMASPWSRHCVLGPALGKKVFQAKGGALVQ